MLEHARTCLVVYDSHVKVPNLLQRVGQIGVCLGELAIQHYASVVKPDALLVVAQLVVDCANQQQQVCPVGKLRVYLRTQQGDTSEPREHASPLCANRKLGDQRPA